MEVPVLALPAKLGKPTFRELAVVALPLRDEQGIRDIKNEWSRYRCHVETAAFIDKPIDEISRLDIRDWLRWMQQKPALSKGRNAHPTEGKLSKETINRSQSTVSAIFVYAIEREFIQANPCDGVKQKKMATTADTVAKFTYLTIAEQDRLWALHAQYPKLRHILLAMMIAVGTGMRPCEQFNMRIEDFIVDGDEPHVNIRLSHPQKGKDAPPKNGKIRKVALMAGRTLDAAREWMAMLPEFAPYNPHNLVFPTERGCRHAKGKWLGRSMTTRQIYDLADIPHRPHLNFYTLRHTFASNLVSGALGRYWRLEEIQVLMGHSSIQITQIYAHLGDDAIRRAVREANAATLAASTALATPAVVAPEQPAPPRPAWYRAVGSAFGRAFAAIRQPIAKRLPRRRGAKVEAGAAA